jgi:hypothetical protein
MGTNENNIKMQTKFITQTNLCQVQPKDEEWSMIVTVIEVIKGGSFVTVIEVSTFQYSG